MRMTWPLKYFQKQALEIKAFGKGQKGRMVPGRAAALQEAGLAPCHDRSPADNLQEFFFSHIIRTRTGDKQAMGLQKLEGPAVQLQIALQRGRAVLAALGESRRVQHDDIETSATAPSIL